MADAFALSGPIDPTTFPFLLMDMHRGGATGSLKVQGPSYQKALYFRGGRILFGSSNDPRDQLGAILIENGTLTLEQLEDANGKVGAGNPLAKVLSETGFVSQRELAAAAHAKVERILGDVVSYDAGSFEFEDGVLPKGAIDLKLPTEKLFLSAVRRISDRSFVLRHLGGLDVSLEPEAGAAERLPDGDVATMALLAQLDGRRSLKEAAAAARLEEFDAAKLACALLFLGIVQRPTAVAADTGAPAVPFILPDSGPGEIDLRATAAAAWAPEAPRAPETAFTPLSEDEPVLPAEMAREPEPLPFIAADSEPPGVAFEAGDSEPPLAFQPTDEPFPARASEDKPIEFAPLPTMALDSPAAINAPEIEVAPAAAEPAAVSPPRPPARVWTPPAAGMRASSPAEPSEGAAARASRPSKDDLAAVDALLKAKPAAGPAPPASKTAVRPSAAAEVSTAVSEREDRSDEAGPGGSRRLVITAAAVLVLAVGAGAAYWYVSNRDRVLSAATPPTTLPAAPPTMAATAPPPATTPPVAPTIDPNATAATSTATAATPPPAAVARPAAAPVTSSAANTLAEARTLLQRGELPAAARGFAASIRRAPAGTASVQLFVACSPETVQKAVAAVGSPELYILPVNYKGRDCFRMCWGLFPSSARAASAIRTVPEYFRQGGASPRVAPASELLP